MNKRIDYRMLLVSGCLWLLAGCSSEEEIMLRYEQDPQAIQLEASIGEASEVQTRTSADGLSWTDGDAIYVREATTGKTVRYLYNTAKWLPDGSDYLRWEGGSSSGMQTTFDAWYPKDATSHTDFTLPNTANGEADQHIAELLMQADWMAAHQVASPGNTKTLSLSFQRKMAKVNITVVANTDFFDGGTITGFRIYSAHSQMEGNVGNSNPMPVCPLATDKSGNTPPTKDTPLGFDKNEGPTYTAIVFPTEKRDNDTFLKLSITSNDGNTTREIPLTGIPELKAGYLYNFKLKTGKGKVEIASVSVEDWKDGTLVGSSGEAIKWDYIGSVAKAKNSTYENAYFWDEMTTKGDYTGLKSKNVFMPFLISGISCSNNQFILTITAPKCIALEGSAFSTCQKLQSADFPSVISVGTSAFSNCPKLQSIDFPSATSVDINAFSYCPMLQSANFPSVTSVGASAFSNCALLEYLNIPNVISIGENAFNYCTSLQSISLQFLETIGLSAFEGCTELERVECERLMTIESYAFMGCGKLSYLRAPSLKKIEEQAFLDCNLDTLIVGTNHSENMNITPNDQGAVTMTSECTLIIGVGTSGNGATSGIQNAGDFERSTMSGYEHLYSWAGLPWKEIIVQQADGTEVTRYPKK